MLDSIDLDWAIAFLGLSLYVCLLIELLGFVGLGPKGAVYHYSLPAGDLSDFAVLPLYFIGGLCLLVVD